VECRDCHERTTDRQRSLATHQYRLAERECLEALQVVRQVPRHRAVATDRERAVECGDQRNPHRSSAVMEKHRG